MLTDPSRYADKDKMDLEGEIQLRAQLRKETFEIEEAHRRRTDRADRINELQGGNKEHLPYISRVDPSIHIDDYTCAELYLHLRDTLEERIERAGTEPTGVKSPLAHKRQPTSAQAAMGMTRKALGESLRLARASSRQNLAPGEEPQSVLDCMRDA